MSLWCQVGDDGHFLAAADDFFDGDAPGLEFRGDETGSGQGQLVVGFIPFGSGNERMFLSSFSFFSEVLSCGTSLETVIVWPGCN